jgi:hypothetical protein
MRRSCEESLVNISDQARPKRANSYDFSDFFEPTGETASFYVRFHKLYTYNMQILLDEIIVISELRKNREKPGFL